MNTIELRKNFHHLIDTIENEMLLVGFYDLMKKRSVTKDVQLWGILTNDEQAELLLALEEIENPANLIRNKEMKKNTKNGFRSRVA